MVKKSIVIVATLLSIGAGCYSQTPVATPIPSTPTGSAVTIPSSKKLDLSGKGLTALPATALERDDLEELDISNNRIGGALPSQIGQLQALRVLDASDNLMTGVPAEIGRLLELFALDLSNNSLTGLPNELANLKKLELLDLRGNDVSAYDLDIIRKGLPNATILTDKP